VTRSGDHRGTCVRVDQGEPYAYFRRALKTRNLKVVLPAAAELVTVNLNDALSILVLVAQQCPAGYPRAAARWVGRLALERRDITAIAELGVIVAAVDRLPGGPELERVLRGLVER
jgi:hypothetical protein